MIFREPVGWRRWSAIAAGFIGVLIIVRPGLAGFSQFSLFALISVAFCALRDLATRRIPAKIPSLFITLLTTVTVTTAGGAILVPLGGWTPPSASALGLLALAAVLLLIGYQCIIMALRSGDISAVAPFRYSALLWAMLLGYLVFGDVPDAMMVRARRSSCCPASTPSTASASVTARWRRNHPACRPTGCDRHGSRHCGAKRSNPSFSACGSMDCFALRSQ